ncbi:MAG: response regulator [Thaumarchaeota archaeon]|nr:MAG: response regulator [Nitrososphaerota archaeon]TLX86588.1 MAG: response regulator [Nitrososphaerota archaeon]TLX89959.1 MAG: response regulator [Nitrososphaerota archaeon]
MTINNRIVGIIDDELDITQLYQDAIYGHINGISVVCFNNPVTALEHFKDNKEDYALVISDLRMRNLNGLELLKKIRMLNPNVRTILVSAYEVKEDEVFQKYMKEGIIDLFIEKPIPIDWLRQKVREQVNAYEQRMNE